MTDPKVDLASLNLEGLTAFVVSLGEKGFRAKQLYRWLHQRGAQSFDEMTDLSKDLRAKLKANTARMRSGLEAAGFTIKPGPTPILPVMLGDAALATNMASELLKRGIYVIGFSYPVVPHGQARIRMQVSAAHTTDEIDRAIAAFTEVGKQLGVLK